ncbi:aladin-like isoform X2 [Tubulanus polymorphus]|uniref:aladin-like isoform X2 n=1 Tax=Tubulanus polymorphus TaxID=672921 RepID=UPI003DA1CBDF
MSSLRAFNLPPAEGMVTICERDGTMAVIPHDEIEHTPKLLNYPDVTVSREMMKPTLTKESARSAFIEHNETLRRRILHAWYEHGITGVLEELVNENSSVSKLSTYLLAAVRWINSLHGSMFPHLSMSSDGMVTEFSSHADWLNSPIRAFVWHPHIIKYAVCLQDDSIRVYSKQTEIVPTLKHKLQKGVSEVAWKPFSASILAVACQTCVLIWHVDPMSLSTRPSTSSVQVLSQSGHCPITSLAWCPKGGVLVSASAADTAMMVWDVATEVCIPLRRYGGGGVSLLRWSPDGSKLLSATPSTIFRVWDSQTWTCEKWSKLAGRCQVACWNPQGTVLLFATRDEPTIYSLTFGNIEQTSSAMIGGSKMAISCIDVSEVEVTSGGNETIRVGGTVHSMVWDPTGERLAVQFTGENGSSLVVLFRTKVHNMIEIIPCGFIRGHPGEKPHLISFQPDFDKGAVLTVVWSSGRVAFIPLYYIPMNSMNPHSIYRNLPTNGHIHQTELFTDRLNPSAPS